MAIFGLDVGEKRVGVASVDAETKVVTPVGVFDANQPIFALPSDETTRALAPLSAEADSPRIAIREGEDTLIVVGMPMNQRGELTAQSERVKEYVMKLKALLPNTAKLTFFGESATTKLAIERLREKGFDDVKIREARASGAIDTEAACIILEGWAEENL